MFTKQLLWLSEKKNDSLNLPIFLHVGNVVDFNNKDKYNAASKGLNKLDSAGFPYAICLSNHDTDTVGENSGKATPGNAKVNLRTTESFNTYFPVKRFSVQKRRFIKK